MHCLHLCLCPCLWGDAINVSYQNSRKGIRQQCGHILSLRSQQNIQLMSSLQLKREGGGDQLGLWALGCFGFDFPKTFRSRNKLLRP